MGNHLEYTQGRFNNHIVHSLFRIMVMVTSVMGVMKMGNVPRVGIKSTSPAFWASVPTITPHRLPDVTPHPPIDTYLFMWLLTREVNADYYTTLLD